MGEVCLQEVMQRIENAFGEEMPFADCELDAAERRVLERLFGDAGFQAYLQDQVYRQIIRDYLVNAFHLGYLSESRMADLARSVATVERRAALALHMLMYSVEQAEELPLEQAEAELRPLRAGENSPPHFRLV